MVREFPKFWLQEPHVLLSRFPCCGCHPATYPQKPGKASLALESSPLVHITLHSRSGNQCWSSLVNPYSRHLNSKLSFFFLFWKENQNQLVACRHCQSSNTEQRYQAWNPKKGCFLVVSWWSHHTQSRHKPWSLHRADQQWKERFLISKTSNHWRKTDSLAVAS